MGSGKQQTRRSRRANGTQDHFEDSSTMEFEHADQKDSSPSSAGIAHSQDSGGGVSRLQVIRLDRGVDDEQRHNTSSEDEGGEGDDSDHRQLATKGAPIDPNVANLVNHASQIMGRSGADGTSMALAATNASTAADAFNLLAASSAVANMRVQRASSNAAYAVTESGLATEGLRNSDSTYEKRFKSYDEELQRLKNRVIFLEGFLGRVLSMMQNGNIDSAEVAQMLRNLGI